MKNMISLIPFAISFILLVKGKKTYFSMFTAALVGITINFILPDNFMLPRFTLSAWLNQVIIGNISTLISIYLLGILMYIITYSKVIACVGNWLTKRMASTSHFIIAVPVLSIILSQDDYLSCLSSGTISGSLATRFGIPKAQIAVICNLTAIAICCISPVSSWSPVISGALRNAGLPVQYSMLTIPYNLVVLFFAVSTAFLCYATVKKEAKTQAINIDISAHYLEETNRGTSVLGIIIMILPVSYIFFSKIMPVTSPLIGACIVSILVALIMLHRHGMIDFLQIFQAGKNAISEMTSLTISLLSIWTFVMVCNDCLGFNSFIVMCYYRLNTPVFLMPAIVFLIAALFSFLTGSSYGSFNLFIPLAAQLSANSSYEYQIITVAAAIAGSLYAAFSYSSDTTALCVQSTNCQISDVREIQFPLAKRILIWSTIGYTMLAISNRNPIMYLLIIFSITAYYTLFTSMPKYHHISYIESCVTFSFIERIDHIDEYGINFKLIRLKEYAKQFWKFNFFKYIFCHIRIPE